MTVRQEFKKRLFKNKVPGFFSLLENAATLFCCYAPEIYVLNYKTSSFYPSARGQDDNFWGDLILLEAGKANIILQFIGKNQNQQMRTADGSLFLQVKSCDLNSEN